MKARLIIYRILVIFFLIASCSKEEVTTSNNSRGLYSPITIPAITTSEIYAITGESAISGGTISSDGGADISERGVCWDTSQNPTTSKSKTNDGSGTGSFSSSITGLSPGVTYYIRSYATNIMGTQYGEEISFSTLNIHWIKKSDFGGAAREDAVGFSIGNKGYVGTGYDGDKYIKDFWEYDPATNTWSQKADFGGTARCSAVGFSIGAKGYIGTGLNFTGTNYLGTKDFWEYDPSTNIWTQKADFAGIERFSAVGFSIGDKGYIGGGDKDLGQYPALNDFWEYDPSSDTWSQKSDIGTYFNTQDAIGFSIGTKGYIGTGYDGTGVLTDKFWEYNPATNTWTQKSSVGGYRRNSAVGFSIGGLGYVGTGELSDLKEDFWEYNPSTDKWTQKTDFVGGKRRSAIGFSIGDKGYVGTGSIGTPGYQQTYFNDFWEFDPNDKK